MMTLESKKRGEIMFKENCIYIGDKSENKLLTVWRWCEFKYKYIKKCPKECKDEDYMVEVEEEKNKKGA